MRLRTLIGASMIVLTAVACASDAPATDAPATTLTSTESTTTPETTAPPVSTDMTVADNLAVTTPSSTSAAAAAASVDVTSRCTEAPEAIVEAVLFDLRSNVAPTACLRPELDDQLETLRGGSFNFEVESTGSQFENVVDGTAGWSVGVALDFDDGQGGTDRVIQSWELVQVGSNLIINEVEELETDRAVAEAEATVRTYLSDLAAGRFDEAAAPLGEGGLNWDERFDITAFPSLPETPLELADALAQWCSSGALCIAPTTTVSRPMIRGGAAEVTATWNIDDEVATATFFSGTYEGAPTVRGLAPLTDATNAAAIELITVATGARVAVFESPSGAVITSVGSQLSEILVPDDAYVWSDGSFVYWETSEADESGQYKTASGAADLSGTVVCETAGSIYLVRHLPDGTYVASVERDDEASPAGAEYPVPNYAVACLTDTAEPIEPRTYRGEGTSRSTVRLAGQTFTFRYDAEGNADVLNEAGVSINGDDYAGFHTFSPDVSTVVYGDYGVSFSPHVTSTIRVRDTATGTLRWSAELPRVFASLDFAADRVIVGLPPEAGEYEPWSAGELLAIYDASTGQRLTDLPTSIEVIHLS